ncbi:Mur ligase family protein [Rhodoferax ferrireducens]|uniref:Mur ligase family protein n=1 Tax=Rhodoferax ferrireducens TaxID=192843 RepID=UPI003BB4FF55
MKLFESRHGQKVKRFIVGSLLEPWISTRRLESYMIFWARFVYRARKPFIIGITGSVGKSTTTAMVASVLSNQDAVHIVGPVGCTVDNMNDDWGVAATVLRFNGFFEIPWDYPRRLGMLFLIPFRTSLALIGLYPKVLVLECGVGSTANFDRLVDIAPPDVAVVTMIGDAHLEVLQSLEGVMLEKSLLVRAAPPSGLVILGQDHEYVFQLEQVARAPVVKVSGIGIELSRNITRAICRHMGISEEVMESGLRDFKSPKRRLERLELCGMTVIDDTYNANPMSMKLGLDTLTETAGPDRRRVAILGFMAELAEKSPRYHEEIGIYARSRSDVLIGVGELSKSYNPDIWFASSEACADRIEGLVRLADCLLVKGSHSARMLRVVERLRDIDEKRKMYPGPAENAGAD